jgi:hypothetical protein
VTPPPTRDLTDTGEQEAIRELAAEKLARRAITPTPAPSVSREEAWDISRKVQEQEEPGHFRRCLREGPACEIRERLEERIERMEKVQEELGATLGAKLDRLTEEAASRKGERGTWAIVRVAVTPLAVALAMLWLNRQIGKSSEDTIKQQAATAAEVAKKLLVDQGLHSHPTRAADAPLTPIGQGWPPR